MKVNHLSPFVLFCVIIAACEVQHDEPSETQEKSIMALDYTNPIVPVVDPNSLVPADPAATIYEVLSGTSTNKLDRDGAFQIVENQIFTLNARKVSRFGADAMEGPLDIFPIGTDETPINTEGTGNGLGGTFRGGPTGRGARSEAGGGNNNGHEGLGAGTGAGLYGIGGATGPGLKAIGNAGDNTAIAALIQGGIRIDDTSPAPTADPGADNTQWAQSINSSRGLVSTNPDTVIGGFNIASFSGNASGVATVTFARVLPGANYTIHVFPPDGYLVGWNGVQNVGNYQFIVRNATTNATVDLTTTALTFSVSTIGF